MYKYLLLGIFLPLLLASCGAMKAVKSTASSATKSTMSAVKNTASGAGKGIASASDKVADSIPGLRPGIDVVEVREDDMKEMPLGKDQAIAYQETKEKTQEKAQKRTFWSYVTPATYVEPTMPDLPDISDSEVDGSLLPPKPL